ncbi:solute carrier family member 5 [Stylonychia lemnae]|uniref:Solute carrier family member 5 n=1 Tax=Stylonychia lemnae TaxID=5949 RepID=A0A078AJW5_STYLE|nr:solute carrier family member 5 [Stylonychia lemnae]|eukprot:CDW81098.1 solute carrier family member 5 [Stylonychia lemnae]
MNKEAHQAEYIQIHDLNQQREQDVHNFDYALRLSSQDLSGIGSFQRYHFFIQALSFCIGSFVIFNLHFLENYPEYECRFSNSMTEYQQCSREFVCNPNITDWRINFNSTHTLNNWIIDFDLHCEPQWKVGLLGFNLFFGILIGSLVINPLGDIWGRATTYRFSMTLSILSNLLMVISYDLYLLYASLFLFGIASAGRSSVGHIWLMEHLPSDSQVYYATISRFLEATAPIITSFVFEYGDIDWRHIYYCTLGVSFFCLLGSFFIPESPKYLISLNRVIEAKRNIKKIAKFNGAYDSLTWKDFKFKKHIQKNGGQNERIKKSTRQNIWKQPKQRANCLVMMINWFGVLFTFYTLNFLLKYMPGSIYDNTRFSSGADLTGYTLLCLFFTYLGAKKSLILFWGLLVILIPILILNTDDWKAVAILLFLNKLSVSALLDAIYIINVQLFEPQVRSYALGYCNILGRFGAIFSPIVAELQDKIPLIVLLIVAILCLTVSCFLRVKKSDHNQR